MEKAPCISVGDAKLPSLDVLVAFEDKTAMDKGQKLDDGLQCPPRAARWGFRRSQVGFRRDGFSSTIQAAPPTNQPCCTVHTCTAFHPLHSCAVQQES